MNRLQTSAGASAKIARSRLRPLELDLEVVYCASIKYQAPDALLWLKTERTDKTSLEEELSVLMINKTEEKEDVETEYFDQVPPDNEQAGSHGDTDGEKMKLPTVRELLESQTNDRACT